MPFFLCVIKSTKSNKATMQRKCFASWQQQQRKNEEKLAPRRRNWSAGQWRCISVSATTARGKWCKRNNFLFFRSKLFPAWLKPLLYCPYYPVRPVCAVRDAVKKHQAPVSGSMRVVSTCPHVHMTQQWKTVTSDIWAGNTQIKSKWKSKWND